MTKRMTWVGIAPCGHASYVAADPEYVAEMMTADARAKMKKVERPQDGTIAELTRFVLVPDLHKTKVASLFLRCAAELWFGRADAVAMITYHDRTRHTGCIYKKAGFKKDGVTRAGTRRGTWKSRPNREQAASSEEASKRRWRLEAGVVRAGVGARVLGKLIALSEPDELPTPSARGDE